jgi:hypothetical protein
MTPTQSITVEVLLPESASTHLAPVAEITAINNYHRRATGAAEAARAHAEEASHFALLAGTLLEDLQASTAHGEWGKLFTDAGRRLGDSNANHGCHFDFSSETARKYIEVAKRIRLDQSLSGKAQKQLAAIASAPQIDEDAREFLNKLTKGQTLRQLYLDLDIITAPAKTPNPDKDAKPKVRKSAAQVKLEDAREWSHTWQCSFEKQVKIGGLDDLDRQGLEDLKEFIATARDRVNKRLA